MMPRWRVDYIGKGGKHLGTVEAPDEKAAIAEAARQSPYLDQRRLYQEIAEQWLSIADELERQSREKPLAGESEAK